ncbi:sulfurtransferase [Marinoscillum sp. 108]|uniref:sulfurtransferase n=1 Tax=Marinoscillum sp. 108 TaxID=2653151 RepID=UPI0012F1F944|nr:rhodanese-like domain-containing protein [Marinoscillum sp. 108]VXD20583.1 3-mercaptopyruvate sulfurtransferase [Marinoscillum sp. 108]
MEVNSLDLPDALVSVNWLAERIHHPEVIVLDASIPPVQGEVDPALVGIRIPRARFFDINGRFSDLSTDLPHMMCSAEVFTREAQALGINQRHTIILYDYLGVYASPRAWWMFRAMGHERVAVLNGGLPAWKAAGLPTEHIVSAEFEKGDFRANPQSGFFRNADQVLDAIGNEKECLIDARSAARFHGTAPEPRRGLRGGHIPNSLNLPFTELIRANQLIPKEELKGIFEKLEIKDQHVTLSCGSGLTACILALGAHVSGYQNLSVYDGSWSEWGQPSDLPVVTD